MLDSTNLGQLRLHIRSRDHGTPSRIGLDGTPHIEAGCELLLEVAGFRHASDLALNEIRADHRVRLEAEPNNAHDPEAVAVYLQEHKIGYVPRQQAPAVGRLLSNAAIAATIERVNGSAERPLIYLFTRIRSSTTSSVSPRRWAQ